MSRLYQRLLALTVPRSLFTLVMVPMCFAGTGPTLPPVPWDGLAMTGPTLPPVPWDGLAMTGPTLPPVPWDGLA